MNKLLCLLIIFFSYPVLAQVDAAPMTYSRTVLKLIPKPEPKAIPSPLPDPKPLPAEKENTKGKLYTKADLKKEEELKVEKIVPPEEERPPAPPPRVPIEFNVEVKAPDFLTQTDFITHAEMAPHEGLLIVYDPVAKTSVTATQMVGTSDVIFINEDGYITKIAPSLNLGELSEPIASGQPVIGVLYIKAGSVAEDRIVPGDRFENTMFKTHPFVVQ